MSRCVIGILLAAALVVGCKRQEADPGVTAVAPGDMPPESPRGPGPMSEAATNSVVIADTGNVEATVQQLTRELRDYVVRTRSVPRNFDEFAAKSQVRFPPAPSGKKYAIQGQAVVLVND